MAAHAETSDTHGTAGGAATGVRSRLAALLLRATDACMPLDGPRDPTFVRRARTAIAIDYVAALICGSAAVAQGLGFGNLGGGPLGTALVLLNTGAVVVL